MTEQAKANSEAEPEGRITQLLKEASAGSSTAFDAVVAEVYPELEKVAQGRLRARYGARHQALTMEPRELVNETLLKMLGNSRDFGNRRHFYSFATKVMMSVLVDYQRRRGSKKRGADMLRVTLAEVGSNPDLGVSILELKELLEQLEELDPRKAEVVKLRFFWGLEVAEIAETLEVSAKTVERDWRFSRSWLASALSPE